MTIGLQTQARVQAPGLQRASVAVCTAQAEIRRRLSAAIDAHEWQAEVHFVDSMSLEETLASQSCDCVLLDVEQVDAKTQSFISELTAQFPDLAIVVACPETELTSAPVLLQAGASAISCRTSEPEALLSTTLLGAANGKLRRAGREGNTDGQDSEPDQLVGCSPAIRRLTAVVERASNNEATVLIEGKEGVGKTLVAQLIHKHGRRASGSLVTLPGQDADDQTLEDALNEADGGTMLLESVEHLTNACQSRLVKFLKDRGGTSPKDVRIIATTSARLAELTAKGSFREDLYYRLNMFPIVVPKLQERREDIPLLATYFLQMSAERDGLADRGFTAPAMIMLEAHPWPGNVVQLRNSIARAHALAEGGQIDRIHLLGPSTGVELPKGVAGVSDAVHAEDDDELTEDDIVPFHEEERRLLNRALRATKGNVRRAAQLLGIGRATLYRKIQVYQLRLQ